MKKIELQATKRDVLGKKVKLLRRQGIIPVHLFGHNVKSLALQCEAVELQKVLSQAGKTRLISLKIDKGKSPETVVVREVQRDSLTEGLLHVDLYQVRITERIRVEVPIVPVGEAPALKSKENMLLQELNSLTIECLPNEIPPNVKVDLSSLTEAEQAIRVGDITLAEGITILNDRGLVVVKIGSRRREEVEEVAPVAPEAPETAPLPKEESKEE